MPQETVGSEATRLWELHLEGRIGKYELERRVKKTEDREEAVLRFCTRYGHDLVAIACRHGSVVIVCCRCGKSRGCTQHRL